MASPSGVEQAPATDRFNHMATAPTQRATATSPELLFALDCAHRTGRPVIQQLGNCSAAAAPATAGAMAASAASAGVTTSPTLNTQMDLVQRLNAQPATAPRLTDRAESLSAAAASTSSTSTAAAPLVAADNSDEKGGESAVGYSRTHTNGFERAVQASEFNQEFVEREYNRLTAEERSNIDEFIWITTGRPARVVFSASDYVYHCSHAEHAVLQRAVEMAQAHRRLAIFSERIATLNIPTGSQGIARVKAMFFDSLARNENDRAGLYAQNSLVTACAFLRGMSVRADRDAEYDAQALGNFDAITKTAARLLVKNNLFLLSTANERQALHDFVFNALEHPSCLEIQAAIVRLNNEAPKAYDLLLPSLTNGYAHAHNLAVPADAVTYGQQLVDRLSQESSERLVALVSFLYRIESGFGIVAAASTATAATASAAGATGDSTASRT